MGRRKLLSPESVAQLRANVEKRSNREWAAWFDVSVVTIIHAKNGKLAYSIERQEA